MSSEKKNISDGSHFYRSLTRNMVLSVIVVSVAPLILISAIVGHEFHMAYRAKVLAHLEELVEKHKQNIDGFLNEKLAYIGVLARTYSYQQLSSESFLKEKLAILQEQYNGVFVDIGVVNERGFQVAYAGPFSLGKADYSDAGWFKKASQYPYFISDVFTGLRGLPHFIVAVQRESNGMKWIVRATIDFVAFNNLVENIQIGETGLAYILNRDCEFQTKPRTSALPDREFFQNLVKRVDGASLGVMPEDYAMMTQSRSRAAKSTDDQTRIVQADNAGKSFIYITSSLKNGDWTLVYQQEEEDAFSDLYNARRLALTIILVGSFGICITAIAVSKRMVGHIARADREKEMMNEQVIEAGKLASVGELAAGIAHEINNPVAIMVEEAGWIEDLLEEEEIRETENVEEFRRALKQIRTQGIRCKEITHKLLSFARKTDPKLKVVELNDLVGDVVGLSEQSAKYSKVKITQNLTPGLPPIAVSPSEMQQVLLNLINNAIDAMDKNGGEVQITTHIDGDRIVVDIADNGQGIPRSNLQRIFDPFFTTKPVGKGTGLGLSICYGIIKKMGGEISVNSAVGVGTTFHISLPVPEENRKDVEEGIRGVNTAEAGKVSKAVG